MSSSSGKTLWATNPATMVVDMNFFKIFRILAYGRRRLQQKSRRDGSVFISAFPAVEFFQAGRSVDKQRKLLLD
ncbi:MAG TPA: hypothetical protein DCE18_02760 [Syntrophobacteraceae bacterium]|nr:hypothetical protein [Syntrophobacteraceae bacterium]